MTLARRHGRRRNWQAALRLICAFALCALAFAHTPIDARAFGIPLSEVAAYTLPDGTVPVLCLATSGHDDHQRHSGLGPNGCEACRLSAALLLPAASYVETVRTTLSAHLPLPPRLDVPGRPPFQPNAAPRAPPVAAA
jgi:hypothetical protein